MDTSLVKIVSLVQLPVLALMLIGMAIYLWVLARDPSKRLRFAWVAAISASSWLLGMAASVFLRVGVVTVQDAAQVRVQRRPPVIPEVLKQDCVRLVEGRLLFEPSRTMHQGTPYDVFARVSRAANIDISKDLAGATVTIVETYVSCKVSVTLEAQESNGFVIEKMPTKRGDEQVLEPDKYTEWDWRVTPRKHGKLHLLLYVTPILYVEGVGEAQKYIREPPWPIDVTSDYVYESKEWIKDNWTIISGLLGVIVVPLFLWFRKSIIDSVKKLFAKKKQYGFPTRA